MTLTEFSEVQCHDLLEGSGMQGPASEPTEAIEDRNAFVLEKIP